jgi:hypothetical protein
MEKNGVMNSCNGVHHFGQAEPGQARASQGQAHSEDFQP